ncbi:MAG: ferredoxin-thioredoxin reductase catalytic domain-containing protein [Candidatus Hatepunaea meridiana]|nr:ferredoxin-thioredoxin reductase catalytic domain-containing protein [Candidatus Hatepunaea meridiana]
MDEQQRTTQEYLGKVADRFDYVLNPDEKARGRIIQYMTENKIKYGKYYCPCKQHYPVDETKDPVCPCPSFKDEIDTNGFCECHIFFNSDAAVAARRSAGLLSTVTCPG